MKYGDKTRSQKDLMIAIAAGLPALLVALLLLLMMLYIVIEGSLPFLSVSNESGVSLVSLFSESVWDPFYRGVYGLRPLLFASIFSAVCAAFLALLMAVPGALYAAVFLPAAFSRFLLAVSGRISDIPAVLYGAFGLFFVVPFLERSFGFSEGRSMLAAVIVLFLMILPGLSHSALAVFLSIPKRISRAALALGATPVQIAWSVILPCGRRQLLASLLYNIVRALGESAALVMVAGNSPFFSGSLSSSVRTLGATMLLEMGSAQGTHSRILLSIAVLLLIIIVCINIVIRRLEVTGAGGQA